jgi:hypothetical protein
MIDEQLGTAKNFRMGDLVKTELEGRYGYVDGLAVNYFNEVVVVVKLAFQVPSILNDDFVPHYEYRIVHPTLLEKIP